MEPDLYSNAYVAQRLLEAVGTCGRGNYSKGVIASRAIAGLYGVLNFKEAYDVSGGTGILDALRSIREGNFHARRLLALVKDGRDVISILELVLQGLSHEEVVRMYLARKSGLNDTQPHKTV